MSDMTLTKTRIMGGFWEGVLSIQPDADHVPEIEVTHMEQPISGHALTPAPDAPGTFHLRIAIPPDVLADGVQTFVIWDKVDGAKLATFSIVTGEPLEDDIRAEVDLLRAELDMLKRAFRRHCLETIG